jgi:hypothetical protein
LQDYQRKVRDIAITKGIKSLYHFTPARNAASILSHGLVSRQILDDHGVEFYVTDAVRLDRRLDAISLSIQSINVEMFRRKMREIAGDWLILELDASVLWTHNCRFCWTNAAAAEITSKRGSLSNPWAFKTMFDDKPVNVSDRSSYRERYGRTAAQPTDMQAEVQVLNHIDPSFIVDFTVKNEAVKRRLEAIMQDVQVVRPIVINESIFS